MLAAGDAVHQRLAVGPSAARADGARPRPGRAAGPASARPVAAAVPGPPRHWGGQLDEARQRFEEMRHVFSRRGIEFQRPYRLTDLAMVEVVAGNLDAAVELADDALVAAHDAGNRQAVAWHGYPAGLAYAHLGRTADAERRGRRAPGVGRRPRPAAAAA